MKPTTKQREEPAAVLLADPPWEHDDALGSRGARANYSTMPTADICTLPLPPLAERCVLAMWKLANMAQDALDVVRAWGFLPLAEVVWTKLRPCATCCATGRVDAFRIHDQEVLVPGSDNRCPTCRGRRGEEALDDDLGAQPTWIGMGTTVRNAHETMILARPLKGRAPERLDAGVRSVFAAPMLIDVDGLLETSCTCGHEKDEHADRGACFARDEHDRPLACRCVGFTPRRGRLVHSAKPDEAYALLERLYPGPRVEMFGRRRREGWTMAHSDQDDRLAKVARVMREDWPRRVREELLAKARRRAARARGVDASRG